MKLLNAFSLNMIAEFPSAVKFEEISIDAARSWAAEGIDSAVGHADTARVFSSALGTEVQANRANVTLKRGDVVLVGQYIGPRLPEGATTLPEGARIVWIRASLAE